MRKAFLILFMLLAILPLSAEGGRMIKLSDTLYEDMEDLYLLNGLSGISSSRPWSESEVKMMLSRLDYDALNPLSRTLFDSIRGKLQEKKYYLAPHVSISPEIYYHTDGEHFRRDTYWHYGFNERNPFVLASIEAGLGPFYTYSELAFGYGRVTGYDTFIKTGDIEDWCGIGAVVPEEDGSLELLDKSVPYSSAFLFNFPKLTMLEIDIPRRTSFTFAFDDMTFGFLRDKLSWGRSKIGNFIFDDHVSRMDYLFLKLYYKRFGFDYVIYLPEVDYSSMNSNLYEGRNRVMLAHMLSFRILDNLSMAVSENVMYSFRTGEFFQFNPAMIFHDLNNSETLNAIAYLELEYVPIRGLRIYTQFVLDQATIITEKNTQPPAFGISLSTEYAMKLGDGILSFFAEGAYTSPYLYRRENVDFIVFNEIAEQSDETIYSYGNTVSSTINPEIVSSGEDKSGDITVKWAVADDTTDQIPDGFTLDPATGVISGSSTESKTSVVKIVGTSQVGPAQTSNKVVTISTEPVMVISAPAEQVFTYPDAQPSTLQLSVNSGLSDVEWSIPATAGVTIDADSGLLTVTNAASAGNIVVTAESEYGQIQTRTIEIVIEEPLTITGSDTISATVGNNAEQQYSCNVSGVTWTVEGAPAGLTASMGTDGKLTVNGNSPMGPLTLTVKATSTNGQIAEYEVTCQIVPQLIFTDPPTGGAIIYGI